MSLWWASACAAAVVSPLASCYTKRFIRRMMRSKPTMTSQTSIGTSVETGPRRRGQVQDRSLSMYHRQPRKKQRKVEVRISRSRVLRGRRVMRVVKNAKITKLEEMGGEIMN